MPGAASSGIRPGQCLVLRILAGRDDAGPARVPGNGVRPLALIGHTDALLRLRGSAASAVTPQATHIRRVTKVSATDP